LLGKSVATVRRLEGVLLHPVEDAKGVWRFEPDEVEQLVAGVRSGRVNLWEAMNAPDLPGLGNAEESCQRCAELQGRLDSLESAMASLRRKHEAQIQALTLNTPLKDFRHAERQVSSRAIWRSF
jgi:hypothetical protein